LGGLASAEALSWPARTRQKHRTMPLSESIKARLLFQHETLQELIGDLPEEQLRRRVHPDKWSAFENIAHLVAYQPVFLQRLERMRKETLPAFERYVADHDPAFRSTLDRPLEELLDDMREKRSLINAELRAMDEATLQKKALHPRYGLFPLAQWADFFLLHEAHHLYTIFMLVQDLRKEGR
jgi:hypothetical protein